MTVEKIIIKPIAAKEEIAPGQEENTPGENVTVEGKILPYGKIFGRIATHKLILPDKTIYLLKGDKKSLDSLSYHNVKVTGNKINLPKQKYPLIEVKILEVVN